VVYQGRLVFTREARETRNGRCSEPGTGSSPGKAHARKLMDEGELSPDGPAGHEAITMVRRRTGSLLGAFYVLIGAALLGSALFAPWYYYDDVVAGRFGPLSIEVGQRDTSFFLLSLPGSGPVQSTCPGGPIPSYCPLSSSYTSAGFNRTGEVASMTLTLATAAFAASALAGVLGVTWRRKPRRAFPEVILTLAAVALAIAATAVYTVLLPGAFAHDVSASQRGYESTGPWSSFYGSSTYIIPVPCPFPGCAQHSASWGPSVGWSFLVAAILVLLVGAVMMIRFRLEVAESVPSSASGAPTSGPNSQKSAT